MEWDGDHEKEKWKFHTFEVTHNDGSGITDITMTVNNNDQGTLSMPNSMSDPLEWQMRIGYAYGGSSVSAFKGFIYAAILFNT